MKSRATTWVLLAGLMWLLPGMVSAGEQARIHIRVIRAIESKVKSIDPKIQDLEEQLTRMGFTKCRLLDRLEATVQLDGEVELQFSGKRTIAVRWDGKDSTGDKAMLMLSLALKPVAKIALRVADGATTLVGGPEDEEGQLIFDVSAKLEEIKP